LFYPRFQEETPSTQNRVAVDAIRAATIRPPIWEVIVLVVVIIIGTMRLI